MRTGTRLKRPMTLELLELRQPLHAGMLATATLETNVGNIEFELLDSAAPATVQNFINYVQDGDYTNSIFHRSVSNFVLQGGGFRATTDQFPQNPATADPANFNEVATDPPVINEFEVSNTRGTVAMAKLGSDPNSATSQYFVNLVDNSANLDQQNGGFTVFARLVDMELVDQIAGFSKANFSSIFSPTSRLSAIVAVPNQPSGGGIEIVRIERVTLSDGLAHGTVYLDNNRDGMLDVGEGGRGGVSVYHDANDNRQHDSGEPSTITDDFGNYHLAFSGPTDYRIRIEDFDGFLNSGIDTHEGTIDVARNRFNLNFGTRYFSASFHNPQQPTNVDAVNGVTPLDALLVVNELSERRFSDAETGALLQFIDPLDSPIFLDVDPNQFIAPLDALLVINDLPSSSRSALSSSTGSPAETSTFAGNQPIFPAFAQQVETEESKPGCDIRSLIDMVFADLATP